MNKVLQTSVKSIKVCFIESALEQYIRLSLSAKRNSLSSLFSTTDGLTEFVIPGKAIYVLKLIKPVNKYFGEFFRPLFNSTWNSAAVIIKQLVIFLKRASARSEEVLSNETDAEVKERSAAGINAWGALLFKSDGIAEINWK